MNTINTDNAMIYLTFEDMALLDFNGRQARIVMLMQQDVERQWSPKDLAEHFDWTLGATAYHVRSLVKAKVLRRARETRVRGAVQHWYVLNAQLLEERSVQAGRLQARDFRARRALQIAEPPALAA